MKRLTEKEQYELWLKQSAGQDDLICELKSMDRESITYAFSQELKFGTGGLRGIIGVGMNRMNIYTVARASQGLANYIIKNFPDKEHFVAIAYDSRRKSDQFARVSAEVFAANNIKVYIYKEPMPTPCLSFAVRQLCCSAGIVITASHNSAKYNGYKVYGPDGCQITSEAANNIENEIGRLDIFNDIKRSLFATEIENGKIQYISQGIFDNYISAVKKQSMLKNDIIDKSISIIYTPLNGTGAKPVLRALKESGYTNIRVVEEQEKPSSDFLTCPYPNPENAEAMHLGIEYCKRDKADLLLATDPDCDRIGIAVRDSKGEYYLLTANETGVLLLDFICSQRIKHGTMPKNPVFMKTIVTSDLAEKIACNYGVRTINTLTGFKFIGEQIGVLEKEGREEDFIFGFEESCGYLSGTYVRDKDGVNAALLICEMFAFYKNQGKDLLIKLEEIQKIYGYHLQKQYSFVFEDRKNLIKTEEIMGKLRNEIDFIAGMEIIHKTDYMSEFLGLPKADVVKFVLGCGITIIVRPSGTEPKLKVYLSMFADDKEGAEAIEQQILEGIKYYIAKGKEWDAEN
ncbi:phospho-sugar mutase [Clostridiaceae bacterium]|nr:phospho-sugar mutase [Clostridiaceae bacterium]RKI12925.1 phospho-sugar mutase [bacterium 1XD21-70]